MRDDAESLAKPLAHEVGCDLSALSVADLDARIELLRAEIERLEADRRRKAASLTAAAAFFKS